ncbi:MAG: alkaline phosphatase family protein, partial [Verrucomicrobiota bacterium]
KMPAMKHLLEHGVSGDLATLQPVLSPMLWTSIATGKRPYKHGVHGFSEPDPVSGSIRPVTNLSRKTKAVWNILNQQGMKSNVIGWWPSNPAEPIDGVMVSNDYQRAGNGTAPDNWPMKPGTVHPERLEEQLAKLRSHPGNLGTGDMCVFLPTIPNMNAKDVAKVQNDVRLQSLASIICDTFSIHNAAEFLIDNEPWDFMGVYYDAIDHFGHGFMKYHPPQRPWISDWDFELFNYVTEAGYRMHDSILASYLQRMDENTTLILISDHGFHPDHLRPWTLPQEPAGPAAEHRDFGIFAAMGPGIRKDELIKSASLLDICPTILTLFDLPVGEDMDGRSLLDIFEKPRAAKSIPSWDEVHEGNPGTHPPDKQISPTDAKASIDQLVALGYIEKPNEDLGKAIEETERELNYNLAQAHIDGGQYHEAMALLHDLYERWPDEHRFGIKLANCYRALRRLDDLSELISSLIARREAEADSAAAELLKEKQRLRARQRSLRGLTHIRPGKRKGNAAKPNKRQTNHLRRLGKRGRARVANRLGKRQQRIAGNLRELAAKAHPNLFSLKHLAAWAEFANRRPKEALEKLRDVDEEHAHRPELHNLRGQIYFNLGDVEHARASFTEANEQDPGNPQAQLGLCRCALRSHQYEAAAEHASASLSKLYDQPWGNYLLGVSYYRDGKIDEAEDAFITAARQSSCFPAPWRMLSQLYRYHRKDDEKAITAYGEALKAQRDKKAYLSARQISEAQKSEIQSTEELVEFCTDASLLDGVPDSEIITIVSGLPRSGTSMLMQMLVAGDIPALTDEKRAADESNPRGYLEYEPATQLQRNQTWIPEAKGKVVKIVAQLLPFLPKKDANGRPLHFRVLFLNRDLDEILESQRKMLEREGRLNEVGKGDLAHAFRHQLAQVRQLLNQRSIPAQDFRYRDAIDDPALFAEKVGVFIRKPDSAPAMAQAIDRKLYRAGANSSK